MGQIGAHRVPSGAHTAGAFGKNGDCVCTGLELGANQHTRVVRPDGTAAVVPPVALERQLTTVELVANVF